MLQVLVKPGTEWNVHVARGKVQPCFQFLVPQNNYPKCCFILPLVLQWSEMLHVKSATLCHKQATEQGHTIKSVQYNNNNNNNGNNNNNNFRKTHQVYKK